MFFGDGRTDEQGDSRSRIMTFMTINDKFNNVHNKKTTIATKTMTKTILGLVTFETL